LAGRISWPPSRISALSNQSRSRPGASSGSTHVLTKGLFFIGMPIPHRDDAPSADAWRPDDHHKSFTQPSGCDEALLTVISSLTSKVIVRPAKISLSGRSVRPERSD